MGTKTGIFDSVFQRISDDFKLKELLPLKILCFTHISTLFVLYPYLTIHMRELGISLEETAIISSVIPLVAIIIPPIAGLIGDKIGNYKLLLAILSALCGLASLFLLLVPVGRVHITFPDRAEMTIGCSGDGFHIDANEYPCESLHPYAFDVDMKLETCGFVCQWSSDKDENSSLPLHRALSYAIKVKNLNEGTTEVYRYPLSSHDRLQEVDMIYHNSVRNLENNVRYKTALRRISKTSLFFPSNGMYDFHCTKSSENSSQYVCEFGSNGTTISSQKNAFLTFLAKVIPTKVESGEETLRLSHESKTHRMAKFGLKEISEPHFNSNVSLDGKNSTNNFFKPTCTNNFNNKNEEVTIEVLFQEVETDKSSVGAMVELEECSAKCLVTTPRKQLCSNAKEEVDINVQLTFWSYLSVRVLLATIGGTAGAMFEGAVIAILREYGGDYGLQKIYGIIGGMISSPLSGILIDYVSWGKDYKDFRPAICLYALLKTLSAFVMLTINLRFKAPAKNLMSDVISVMKNLEIIILFVVIFILGTAWGYIESFLFWLLQDLGASNSLMGITVTVGGIGGIPLLILSGPLIDRFGHANVLFVGFIFYAIRLLGYSLIYDPWLALIFEALEGITTSLTFTAAVTYAASLSSITTDTSVQGMLGGLYHGVGKGAGSLVGGYMMKAFGTRPTYQIFSGIALITGCIYFVFNKLYVSRRISAKEQDVCEKGKEAEAYTKPDIGNGKMQNEKMPLKDVKNNITLYLENSHSINGDGCEKDDKIMIDPKKSILERDDNGKNGVDNPVFEEIDLKNKSRSNSIYDSKQIEKNDNKIL